jgi:cAMP phosphodiesterase
VSLSSDRENGGGYRLTTTVLSDDSMRLELIHDIELTITRWKSKLHLLDSDLAELLEKMETAVTRRKKTQPAAQLAA